MSEEEEPRCLEMCQGRSCQCEKAVSVALSVLVAVNVCVAVEVCVSARVGAGGERGSGRQLDPGCARGAPSSAGTARVSGRVQGPDRGRPRTPATAERRFEPGDRQVGAEKPGWGLVGKSAGAATELTVAGDVVVPGRVAGGPRGAAELQEKCQVVEGAQRPRQRGSHGVRSGRGRRRFTSGLRKPQTQRPPSPAGCGLAAGLQPRPLVR